MWSIINAVYLSLRLMFAQPIGRKKLVLLSHGKILIRIERKFTPWIVKWYVIFVFSVQPSHTSKLQRLFPAMRLIQSPFFYKGGLLKGKGSHDCRLNFVM